MENKPHILCVDDDNKIRELLKVFLRKNNFSVTTAESVDEAKKILNFFIFDIIVLDIMMPRVSGFPATRASRIQLCCRNMTQK